MILTLLGENVGTEGIPDVKIFNDLDQLKLKMNCKDPLSVTEEIAKTQGDILNNVKDKYTKKGSPKEFKKVHKYDSLHNWASKFVEVIIAAYVQDKTRIGLDLLKVKKQETAIKIDNYKLCLEDLKVFDYENLKTEKDKLQNLIWKLE